MPVVSGGNTPVTGHTDAAQKAVAGRLKETVIRPMFVS